MADTMTKGRGRKGFLAPVEAKDDGKTTRVGPNIQTVPKGMFRIIPIKCHNEWVVIAPFAVESTIYVPSGADYRNIGVVVGKSEKLMAPNGAFVDNPLAIGSVVMFTKKAVIEEMVINQEPYEGRRLVLLSQRNVICELVPIPVEILDGTIDAGGNQLGVKGV